MPNRDIENAPIKNIVGARIYDDFPDRSDEAFLVELKKHWENVLVLANLF